MVEGSDLSLRATMDTSGVASGVNQIKSTLGGLGGTIKGVTSFLGSANLAFQGISRAAQAAGQALIGTAANFQQSMANVASVTGGGAEAQAKLSAAAREAGATSVFSASQAADAMYYLASAGQTTDQIAASLKDTLNMAAAGQMDLAQSSEILTNTLAQFKLPAEEAGRVTNTFSAAAAATNTTIGQLGMGMGYVGPVAASLGFSLEETTAALGLLANAGLKGERGGTALRGALSALMKPSSAAAAALSEMGLTIQDVDPAMHSLTEIVDALSKGSMTAAQAVAIFGQEAGPSMLALASSMDAAGNKGGAALQALTDKITGTNKAAEMAAMQNETFRGSLKMLGSAIEEAQISAGNEFLPILTEGVKAATEGVLVLTDNFDTLKGVLGHLGEDAQSAFSKISEATGGMAFGAVGVLYENRDDSKIKESVDWAKEKFHAYGRDIKIDGQWYGSEADLDKAYQAGILVNEQYVKGLADMSKSKNKIEGATAGLMDSLTKSIGKDLVTGEAVKLDADQLKSQFASLSTLFETFGDEAATNIGEPLKEAFESGSASGEQVTTTLDKISQAAKKIGPDSKDSIERMNQQFKDGTISIEQYAAAADNLNMAATVLGSSFDAIAGPIQQLWVDGKLSLDEYNQTLQQLTYITNMVGTDATANMMKFTETMSADQTTKFLSVMSAGIKEKGGEAMQVMAEVFANAGDKSADVLIKEISTGLGLDLEKAITEPVVDAAVGAGEEAGKKGGEKQAEYHAQAFLDGLKGYEATFAAGRSMLTGELLTVSTVGKSSESFQSNRATEVPWKIYLKPEIVDVGTKSGGITDWDVAGEMISGGSRGRAISTTVTSLNELADSFTNVYGDSKLAAAGVIYIMEQSEKGGRALELFRERQAESYDQWKQDNAELIASIDPTSDAFAEFTRQLELDWEETQFQKWVDTLPLDLQVIEDFSVETQHALYNIYEGMEIPDSIEREGGIAERIVELSAIGDEDSQKILDNINTARNAVLNGLEARSMDPDQFNILDGYLDFLISQGADESKVEEVRLQLQDKLNPYEIWGSPQHVATYFAEYGDLIKRGGSDIVDALYSLEWALAVEARPGWENAWKALLDPEATQQEIDTALDQLEIDPDSSAANLFKDVRELSKPLADLIIDPVKFNEYMTKNIQDGLDAVGQSLKETGIVSQDWIDSQIELFGKVGDEAMVALLTALKADSALWDQVYAAYKEKGYKIGDAVVEGFSATGMRLTQELMEQRALEDQIFSGASEFWGADKATRDSYLQDYVRDQKTWWTNLLKTDADYQLERIKRGGYAEKEFWTMLTDTAKTESSWYTSQQLKMIDYVNNRWAGIENAPIAMQQALLEMLTDMDTFNTKVSDQATNLANLTAEASMCEEAMSSFGIAQEKLADQMFFKSYIGPTEGYYDFLASEEARGAFHPTPTSLGSYTPSFDEGLMQKARDDFAAIGTAAELSAAAIEKWVTPLMSSSENVATIDEKIESVKLAVSENAIFGGETPLIPSEPTLEHIEVISTEVETVIDRVETADPIMNVGADTTQAYLELQSLITSINNSYAEVTVGVRVLYDDVAAMVASAMASMMGSV